MPGKLTSIPISRTKIMVPHRRPELLSRPRLLESLQALLGKHELLLLSAPAGYGKTSLLIDLAHHTDMPVCWLSLDELDRDPQRFLAYLIAALAEKLPGVGASSRYQLRRLTSVDQDAETILIVLTNEILDCAQQDFLLILDDYHLLDEVPIISDLVSRFLQLVDSRCHLLLSSRTTPPLEDVTLMLAREQVAGLGHAELAFRPRELQALYAQNYHRHLSDEAAHQMVDQTGGWITGMVLSSLPGGIPIAGLDMFAYLGRQVLDEQPAYIREFLLRTSLADEFSAEFCEMVLAPLYSEPQNWLSLMGLILERNLFVLPLGEDGRWLRYHHLFRDFLQARLKAERPHEVQPILERMVAAYEKAGEWERAYYTCTQLHDSEALAPLIERSGTTMLQTAFVTLEGWINRLPSRDVQTRPGLISLRGVMEALRGDFQVSHRLLDTAVSLYRESKDAVGLSVALMRRANTLRLLGKYDASLKDLEESLAIAAVVPDLQPVYAEALRIKGANLYRLGQARRALAELQHSLALYTELKEAFSIPILMAELAMVYATLGDVESAKALYRDALKIWRREKNSYYEAEALNNLAVLYHHFGEYEAASDCLEEGVVCARSSRNRRTESLLLTGLGDLYAELEDFEAARLAYEQAETIAVELPGFFVSNYLVLARANMALLQHDIPAASRLLRTFRKKLNANPSAYERGLWSFLQARSHLLKKETKKAIPLLQESKAAFTEGGREVESQWCRVWLIAAYSQAGQIEPARAEFEEMNTGGNKVRHPVLITACQALPWLKPLQADPQIGRSLSGLLEKAKQLGETFPSIRRTLRRHAQSIRMPAASMNIRAFGTIEVTVQGRAIMMSDWRTKAVRDLFFYFLSQKEALTKEQVAGVLWPEVTDIHVVRKRFKDQLFRLRRAVGRDVNAIVFEEDFYAFNRALDYEYDVEAFESYLKRARQAQEVDQRIEYYQKAVDQVRGPYLGDVDALWAVAERERLGQVYMLALEELARLYLNTNRLEQCLAACQLALKQERYREGIYQLEMHAYAALGDRPSIAMRYRACREALKEGLGLAPSPETENIYRELTA